MSTPNVFVGLDVHKDTVTIAVATPIYSRCESIDSP